MIKLVADIDRESWRELIKCSPFSSYFQSPEFYDFYSTLSFLDVFGWAVFDRENRLQGLVCGYTIADGGLFKRYFSRRAIIQGGVLLRDGASEDVVRELLSMLRKELRDKAIYVEVRNSYDYSVYSKAFSEEGFSYQPHLNYIVETSLTIDEIRARYDRDRRRELRRVEDIGLKAEFSYSTVDMEAFYAILSHNYRNKIKKPLFCKEFFLKALESEHYRFMVIRFNGRVVGGNLFLAYGDRLYGLFIASEETNSSYISISLIDSVIDVANKEGFCLFDFMGAGSPDKPYGVRDFKAKFGGRLIEFGRFVFVSNRFLYCLGKMVLKMKILYRF